MQAKITEYANMTKEIEKEESFQETEVGLLPQDWKVMRLGDVAGYLKAGGTPRRSIKKYWGGSVPFVRIGDITAVDKYLYTTNGTITEEGLKNSSTWLVPENSILLSMYASIGEVAITKIPLATNQAILAIIPKENVDVEFLFYCLKYHGKRLYSFIVQTTQKNVNRAITENLKIPVPPLTEQKKIAKVLGTIQKGIEQHGKIIDATKNLKKSLMQELFTQGLGHIEFKETEIGQIPESWEIVKLVDVVDFSRKPRDLNLNSFEKIPFITMEMIPIEKTYVNAYVLKEPDRISSGVYCEKGDILLPKITPCFENGKQGIIENIPCDFAFATTEVYPIKPKNAQLDKMFLFYFLAKLDVRKTIAGKMQGTTGRRRVPKDVVKNTLIPLPTLPEQREIARILSILDKKIEVEERRKNTLEELFKTTLHKLITAEIRLKDIEV